MHLYELSVDASNDVSNIADFTVAKFGIIQSRHYKEQLKACLKVLAENPKMGRDASEFSANLRYFPFKAHTIFYKPTQNGIFIIRILGKNQDFAQHL